MRVSNDIVLRVPLSANDLARQYCGNLPSLITTYFLEKLQRFVRGFKKEYFCAQKNNKKIRFRSSENMREVGGCINMSGCRWMRDKWHCVHTSTTHACLWGRESSQPQPPWKPQRPSTPTHGSHHFPSCPSHFISICSRLCIHHHHLYHHYIYHEVPLTTIRRTCWSHFASPSFANLFKRISEAGSNLHFYIVFVLGFPLPTSVWATSQNS